MGGILLDILRTDAPNLSKLEEPAAEAGHAVIADAVALALEARTSASTPRG